MFKKYKLSCGHIVERKVRPYYSHPPGTHWCNKCCTYKPIIEIIEKEERNMCNHQNTKVVGEWKSYKVGIPLLVRECQDCGAIHLGNGPKFYPSYNGRPHWSLEVEE